jgi:hypothetical protein
MKRKLMEMNSVKDYSKNSKKSTRSKKVDDSDAE